MITVYAPLKRSLFQPITFGTINYNNPAPGVVSSNIDEIIISDVSEGDPNQVDFIKRYNTWFLFTAMDRYPLLPYSIILINYDRVNRVAYTFEDTLRILRKA